MFDLIRTGEHTFTILSHSNVGIYLADDSSAYLIDTSFSGPSAKKILEITRNRGWKIEGIINTHSHIDHIGGNDYIQSQTACNVFAPAREQVLMQYPDLPSAMLYGGYPPDEIRKKFTMPESHALPFDSPEFPNGLEIITLPGHFFEMAGVITPDRTAFLADALFGEKLLAKTGITYIYNVGAFLDTLDKIERLECDIYVPSHAEPVSDIRPLVKVNRDKIAEIGDIIISFCSHEPVNVHAVTRHIIGHFNLKVNIENYTLILSTVRSYLSWLNDNGRINLLFDGTDICWQS